jgi:hypothetical protein
MGDKEDGMQNLTINAVGLQGCRQGRNVVSKSAFSLPCGVEKPSQNRYNLSLCHGVLRKP